MMNIAVCVDNEYAMASAVTIFSAVVNASDELPVHVFVVHAGISGRNEDKLREVVRNASPRAELTLLRICPDILGPLGTPGHFSMAAYYRVMLPEVMPAREAKVIYLDSDLLVRGDLSILWRMDMKGMPLMAVRDFAVPFTSSKASGLNHLASGPPHGTPFLNTGVMVMDLGSWRAGDLSRKIIAFARDNEATAGLDQVGVNALIAGRWLELDHRWNVQVYINCDHNLRYIEKCDFLKGLLANRQNLMKNALIYHFSGGRKPWVLGCALPGQFAWLGALRRSNWHKTHVFIAKSIIIGLDVVLRKSLRSIRSLPRLVDRRAHIAGEVDV